MTTPPTDAIEHCLDVVVVEQPTWIRANEQLDALVASNGLGWKLLADAKNVIDYFLARDRQAHDDIHEKLRDILKEARDAIDE